MRKITLIKVLFVVTLLVCLMPSISFAQNIPTNPSVRTGADGGTGSNDPVDVDFQFVTCSGVDDPRTPQKERECTFEDIILTARRIIYFALFMITPILVAMLVYTGFKYMTAGGDVNLIADAKRMLKPVIYGLILVFAAWLIVYTLLGKLLALNINDVSKDSIVPSSIRY